MSHDFLDFAIEFITVGWFAWLLAWPYFVFTNVIGWGSAAAVSSRRGASTTAWWCLASMILILLDGYVILTGHAFRLLAAVPSNWRLLAQLALLTLPLVVSFVGLLWLGLWVRRIVGQRPNSALLQRTLRPRASRL